MRPLKGQLRRHSVALVSLFVAFSSLAYNTWRNEKTEMNRNVRTAGVEMLLQLGELDHNDDAAAEAISDSIDRAREDILQVLASLQ
jgi:hypothetical protein